MIRTAMLLALFFLPLPLSAQVRASEVGGVTQMIDGTKLSIEYSRPRLRGRDTLFSKGDMRWGDTWTPGANWATTLEVSKAVKLNGHPLPKGKYSVWMVLRRNADWTIVLDPKARMYHMNPPDSNASQIRFAARAEPAPLTDVLSWSMPAIRMNGGTLVFEWEHWRVPIDVEVEPSLVTTLSAADAAPYLGRYTWTELDRDGKPKETSLFTVTHEDGTLKAQYTPDDPYFRKFALVRIAPDWFAPGVYDKKGVLYEVLKPEMTFEFARESGKVTRIVLRDEDDHVTSTAVRKP
ncbi:MAG: DUF2911 domain-containing protein [Gemmatimonadaceae bacterium]